MNFLTKLVDETIWCAVLKSKLLKRYFVFCRQCESGALMFLAYIFAKDTMAIIIFFYLTVIEGKFTVKPVYSLSRQGNATNASSTAIQ